MSARTVIIVVALGAVALLAVVPPYRYVYREPVNLQFYAGHAPVFSPPSADKDHARPRYKSFGTEVLPSVEIDIVRLLLEWVGVAASATIAAMLVPVICKVREPMPQPVSP